MTMNQLHVWIIPQLTCFQPPPESLLNSIGIDGIYRSVHTSEKAWNVRVTGEALFMNFLRFISIKRYLKSSLNEICLAKKKKKKKVVGDVSPGCLSKQLLLHNHYSERTK